MSLHSVLPLTVAKPAVVVVVGQGGRWFLKMAQIAATEDKKRAPKSMSALSVCVCVCVCNTPALCMYIHMIMLSRCACTRSYVVEIPLHLDRQRSICLTPLPFDCLSMLFCLCCRPLSVWLSPELQTLSSSCGPQAKSLLPPAIWEKL